MGLCAGLGLVLACHHANPNFDGSGTESGGDGDGSGGLTSADGSDGGGISLDGGAGAGSGNSDSSATTSTDSGESTELTGSDETSDGPEVPVLCPGFLFASTETEQLLLLDLDNGVVSGTQALDWPTHAIATDPDTGDILYTPIANGEGAAIDSVIRHDPDTGTSEIVGSVGAKISDPHGRAAATDGTLWLGAQGKSRQVTAIMTEDPSTVVGTWTVPAAPPNGGDLAPIGDNEFMIVSASNQALTVVIEGEVPLTTDPVFVENITSALTGLAVDGLGDLWAADAQGNVYQLDDPYLPDVIHSFSVPHPITDLARVWALEGDCPLPK